MVEVDKPLSHTLSLSVRMLTFLFWNIAKKPLEQAITRLVAKHRVDFLMLAESELDPPSLVAQLAASVGTPYTFQPSDRRKLQVYSGSATGRVVEQYVDPTGALTVRRLDLPAAPGILVAILHMVSKVNWSITAQAMHSVELAGDIRRVEGDVGHTRTLLVGDFNMNPFEPGVVGMQALHAVMTRHQLRRGSRTVQGREYSMFYNPMWGLFGDRTPGPAGTFLHRSPPPDSTVWNIYDQVLLRPQLADRLTTVEVLDSDGTDPLVDGNGLPSQAGGSDHLPLLFRLDV
ncbi:MAG: endonuclease/exonuclease/phosphatase family protein [Tepidisphaerales bacterium]